VAVANPRIEELRRRIHKDPASIAFAQLAEEHRRAREYEDAIRVCRTGLEQHPAYLSARITLGRALLEVGQLDDAATEFEYVLKAAPDNLTAIRELANIHQRRRASASQSRSAEQDAPQPPVEAIQPPVIEVLQPPVIEALQPPVSEAVRPPLVEASPAVTLITPITPEPALVAAQAPAPDPVLAELEAWLSVLVADRVTGSSRL
jgi:tetratricopeptide (TPR) repeat protein